LGHVVERRPYRIEYTYHSVLLRAIMDVVEALEACRRSVEYYPWFRGAVDALWRILPPDVKADIVGKLGVGNPDKYVLRVVLKERKEFDKKMLEEYGELYMYCKPWLDEDFFPMECNDIVDEYEKAAEKEPTVRVNALADLFETVIELLHAHGWLAKEETLYRYREQR